ncbi:MAG: hypothetical protein ABI345_09530 [Jatrophihabitans sp.]
MYLNYRRAVVAGATAAVIIGAGGTSLALTGSDTVNGSPTSPTGTTAQHGKHGKHGKHGDKGRKLLKRLEHAEITTQGKKGEVTHDLIRGTVMAVSTGSITVQAKDSTTESFVINSDTKFRERTKGQKPAASSVAKIATGDMVFVAGKAATTPAGKPPIKPTAERVVEFKK